MNLIEKVVIKDGVNADTTVTINQYTGQVAEINAKIAHPFIPNTRGIAAYSLDAGITPRFSFAAVGDNEMWVYVDGIGIKVDGITTLAPDTAIKVLPNSGSTTYSYSSGDNGKMLIITSTSLATSINSDGLSDGQSFFILNNSSSNKTISGSSGGDAFLSLIKPKTLLNVYRVGNSVDTVEIASPTSDIINFAYSTSQVVSLLEYIPTKNAALEMAYSGAKTVNVPSEWPTGKKISIVNLATTGSISVVLPSGETTRSGFTTITITPISSKTLVRGSSGYWFAKTENIE